MGRRRRPWADEPAFPWQRNPCDPGEMLSGFGWPFVTSPEDLPAMGERVQDAVMVCEAIERIVSDMAMLDAAHLLASVGPDPSAFVRGLHASHAVAWNRPADRRGTMHGISWGAGTAVADCQVALGVSTIPVSTGHGGGAYVILLEPCFKRALYEGRTLREIAAIVSTNELRKGARLVPWLRKEPGATDPVEDRDFWLGWPGNGPRLLRACRDLVSRRVGWRGGIGGGEPAEW